MAIIEQPSRPLSLEDIRARVQERKKTGVDVSKLTPFEHEGLGGTVYYGGLSSFARAKFDNVAQYYPLSHDNARLRGTKASTPELDEQNRERILLKHGVRTADGKPLDDTMLEWMLRDELCGPANNDLAAKVLKATIGMERGDAGTAEAANDLTERVERIEEATRWEVAFFDLLKQTGWVKHWVEYVTSQDTSTAEMKEAAAKLLKLEQAAPEWDRWLQSEQLARRTNAAEESLLANELALEADSG